MKSAQWLLAIAMLAVTGCSSFHREWRQAGKLQSTGIAGRWEGNWRSDVNGHNGRLRCLLTPITENRYEARFHATYKKILSFGYTAILGGATTNDVFYFSGDADLGPLAGGVYHYEGQVDPTNFFSIYRSKYDHGTFELQRPD